MVVPGRLTAALGAGLLAMVCAWPVAASGPSPTAPWYLDEYGGDPPDMASFYAGRAGIVMPMAPRPQLFISWRDLHGLKVGQAAGERLARPCCDTSDWRQEEPEAGAGSWRKARESVPGAVPIAQGFTQTGPDNTEQVVCFGEAFELAAGALKDREARYGAGSRDVKAWLTGQDAVFASCSGADARIPPLPPGAPAWLAKDHDYQAAAKALYARQYADAAKGFAAIGRDPASPWRGYGPYLEARALVHLAITIQTPAGYELADAALDRLAATPAGAFGRGEVRGMRGFVMLHRDKKAYLADLTREMSEPTAAPDIAVRFRDFSELGDAQPVKPEILDWIATMRAVPPANPLGAARYHDEMGWEAADQAAAKAAAFAHAAAKWRTGHDTAWLIAALSLTAPGDAGAGDLVRAARAVPKTAPGWLSAQYHLIRLTLPSAPAAESRKRLDAILRRKDLSVSDRNVITAQRTQVAASLDDFVRHALRQRLCESVNRIYFEEESHGPPPCARSRWDGDGQVQPSGVYDGLGDKGRVGLGEDARAILDRAPLATRMTVAEDRRIPPTLRLDLALTSYGRAVALQDDAAIDRTAGLMAGLLPLMAADFRSVVAAKPGADKRFAEFFVLAKIPGVRTDLPDPYTRPQGRSVAAFQTDWADWIILRGPGLAAARPPPLAAYQQDGTGATVAWTSVVASLPDRPGTPDARTDLTCLGECGRGAAPLRLPDFVAAGQGEAARERARFVTFEGRYDDKYPAYPKGGVSAWDEMLDYARAHPADPRVPEALHWLVHVGHFGGSHNHSGHRAFKLLHARYAGSYWAKKTPFYND